MANSVVIAAAGPELDDKLAANFARSRYFVVYDLLAKSCEGLRNPSAEASLGAGKEAAQLVAQLAPRGVITTKIGPIAFARLAEAGISVFSAPGGTVREAIQTYHAAHLAPLTAANAVPGTQSAGLDQPHANLGVRRARSQGRSRRGRSAG